MRGVLNVRKASVHEKKERVFCGGGYRVPFRIDKYPVGQSGIRKTKHPIKLNQTYNASLFNPDRLSLTNLQITRSSQGYGLLSRERTPMLEEESFTPNELLERRYSLKEEPKEGVTFYF